MRSVRRVDPNQPVFPFEPAPAREAFRKRFQDSFSVFLRKGFRMEQCFQFVWQKTLEEIQLPENDQRKLQKELVRWTRQWSSGPG